MAEGLLGSEERVIIVSSKTNDSFEQCAAQASGHRDYLPRNPLLQPPCI